MRVNNVVEQLNNAGTAKKPICFNLPADTHNTLVGICRSKQVSISFLMRAIVKEFITSYQEDTAAATTAVAGGLGTAAPAITVPAAATATTGSVVAPTPVQELPTTSPEVTNDLSTSPGVTVVTPAPAVVSTPAAAPVAQISDPFSFL